MSDTIFNQAFDQYELIDCGNGLKWERFNQVSLIRPDNSCKENLDSTQVNQWRKAANAEFISESDNNMYWKKYTELQNRWPVFIDLDKLHFQLMLNLTDFKHIGVFPEQSGNWLSLYQYAKQKENARILNLFAYTGAASLAASIGGASVTHVESSQSTLNWARENAALNKITKIRWINDDAVRFVEREIKRGNKYDLVILDPPVFGQSKGKKKWKLEKDLFSLLKNIYRIVNQNQFKIILNTYSPRIGERELRTLETIFPASTHISHSNLYIKSSQNKKMYCGILTEISQ